MSHTHSRIVAAVLTLALPLQAVALGVISANDSIAGIGIDVEMSGLKPSATINVQLTDPEHTVTRIDAQTNASGHAILSVPGKHTEIAGTYTIDAYQDRTKAAESTTLTVEAGTMDPWTSSLQTWTPRINADGRDEAEIDVTLRDEFGNVLAGRPVTVISSRPDDVVRALTPETNNEGVQHFSLTTDVPGQIQLRAVDLLSGNTVIESANMTAGSSAAGGPSDTRPFYGSADAPSSGRQMFYAQLGSFDVIEGFEVIAPATLARGVEAQRVTVRAIDRNGNLVEDYVGTVDFSSTDPNAQLPNFGSYTFKDRDLGEKSFPLVLKFATSGMQIFRVEDANNPAIFGEAEINVGGTGSSGSTGNIQITSHQNDDEVNSTDIVVSGRGPAFANLIVMGGVQDATGSTDENGAFSIPVNLSPTQRDFTIRVRDDSGRNDSGPIHLILDQIAPKIGTIVFAPENPEEGEKTLIAVESEPGLGQVILRLPAAGGTVQDIVLAENSTASGSYQAFFTAPAAGSYQPAIAAMDRAGNVEEIRTTFSVGSQSLPVVQNVTAEPRVNAVALQWDPVGGEVNGYRIYVGTEPDDFLYTLDTERVTTKATVAGLAPGTLYYFAVTALKGDAESEERSKPIEARVLGLTLDVMPEANALNVEWTSLSTDLPLSSFLLEYGVSETSLTENRMLNGDLRNYTIRDLLEGVEYFIRLTPITVTGDKLDELASKGSGTPGGEGFAVGPRDDVPFDVVNKPGNLHSGAPNTPSSGVPPLAWMLAAACGALGVWYRIKRRKHVRQTDAFLQAISKSYEV